MTPEREAEIRRYFGQEDVPLALIAEIDRLRDVAAYGLRLARQATNGWACYAKRKIEDDDIARLHGEISAVALQIQPAPPTVEGT